MSCKTWEVFHWLEASPPLLLFVFLFHDHRVEPSPLLWASKSKCYDPDKHFHFLFNFHKRDLRLSWLQSYSINLATFTFLSCCDFADVFILLQWSFLGQDVMMIIITISNKSMFFPVQKFTSQPLLPLLLVRFPSNRRPWKIQINYREWFSGDLPPFDQENRYSEDVALGQLGRETIAEIAWWRLCTITNIPNMKHFQLKHSQFPIY